MFTLPRTGSRGDGLACFVKDGIEVLDRQVSPGCISTMVHQGGCCTCVGESITWQGFLERG